MELTQELFEGITGFGPAPRADGHTPNERRRHRRFTFGSRANFSPLNGGLEGVDSVAMIREISQGGLSLLCSKEMAIGDEFVVQFSGEFGWPARILCACHRCEAGGAAAASFVIGASFKALIDVCGGAPAKNALAECGATAAPSKTDACATEQSAAPARSTDKRRRGPVTTALQFLRNVATPTHALRGGSIDAMQMH